MHVILQLRRASNSCVGSLDCGEGGSSPGKPWASAGTDTIGVLKEKFKQIRARLIQALVVIRAPTQWPPTLAWQAICKQRFTSRFRFCLSQVYQGWWWSGPTAESPLPTVGPPSAFTRATSSSCCLPTCTAPGGRCVSLLILRILSWRLWACWEKNPHRSQLRRGGGVVFRRVPCLCSIVRWNRCCHVYIQPISLKHRAVANIMLPITVTQLLIFVLKVP